MKARKIIFVAILIAFAFIVATDAQSWLGQRSALPMRRSLDPLYDKLDDLLPPTTYALWIDDFWVLSTTYIDTACVVADHGTTAAIVDSLDKPGILKISLPAYRGNGMNVQGKNANFRMNGSPANPDSVTVAMDYECLFSISVNTTQYTLFAGLSVPATNYSSSVTNAVMFKKRDNTDSLFIFEKDADSVDSSFVDTLDDVTDWHRLGIVWNGSAAKAYVDGVYKTYVATAANQPTGVNLTPSFEVVAGDSTARYVYLDYIWTRQKR